MGVADPDRYSLQPWRVAYLSSVARFPLMCGRYFGPLPSRHGRLQQFFGQAWRDERSQTNRSGKVAFGDEQLECQHRCVA